MSDDVFTMRDDLAHIRRLAQAELVGPDGLLAMVVAHVLAATEPTVTTDVTVGGRGSLNFITGLVGPSGAGKGTLESVAADQVKILDHAGRPVHTPVIPIGSGEGVGTVYRPRGTKDGEPHARTRVMFSAPEVDSMNAISSRTGSTLTSAFRRAWSGELLGENNAAEANSTSVPRHTYRFGAVIGIQPRRAGALLAEGDGGLPQRILWARVGDPDATDEDVPHPGGLTIQLPRFDGKPLVTAPSIIAEYRAAEKARVRTRLDSPAIEGHSRYLRLKIAAALAIMETRLVIGVPDWELAGSLVARSSDTREAVRSILTSDTRDAIREKATQQVVARFDAGDATEAEGCRRVRKRIVTFLEGQDGNEATRGAINKAVRQELRLHLDTVLDAMSEAGELLLRDYGHGPVYILAGCTVHDLYTTQNAA